MPKGVKCNNNFNIIFSNLLHLNQFIYLQYQGHVFFKKFEIVRECQKNLKKKKKKRSKVSVCYLPACLFLRHSYLEYLLPQG